jgi:hypothetical protein
VLLTRHQLKGIYLSRISVNDADNRYWKHRLRDHMVKFLEKRRTEGSAEGGGGGSIVNDK